MLLPHSLFYRFGLFPLADARVAIFGTPLHTNPFPTELSECQPEGKGLFVSRLW